MPLESANFITGLVDTNPAGTDQGATSDDHHRLTKRVLKNTFPNFDAAISITPTEANYLSGASSNIQNQLDDLDSAKLDISATAVYAQSAGGAASAVRATSASAAYSARFATSASAATNAVSADRASSAINATNAVNATNATSAAFAASAGSFLGNVSAGQVPSATTANYAAATDASKFLTAALAGRPLSAASDGYVTLGPITIQWGTETSITNGTSRTVTFPKAFGSTPWVMVASCNRADMPNADNTFYGWGTTITGSTAGAIRNEISVSADYFWIAVGPT